MAFFDVRLLLWVCELMLDCINLVIKLGVLDFKVGLLDQVRDLLKAVVSIIGMMKHDAVEYLGEVGVEIELDC